MKILVFGATGLIGRAVSGTMVKAGHEVLGVARSARSAAAIRELGVTPVWGDMTDPATWREAAKAADAVVQLAAAFDGDLAAADNAWTNGIVGLAGERARPLRVVYTGGCWLYPPRTDPPLTEADAFEPLPPFGFMVEHRKRLLNSGVDLFTIHPGMVWSETNGCTSEFRAALESGKPVEVIGSTLVSWPLVHVDDLAELYVRACAADVPGCDVFGVTDPGVTVGEIVTELERITGQIGVVDVIAVDDAIKESGSWAAGLARSQRIETDLAKRELGWCPQRSFGRSA